MSIGLSFEVQIQDVSEAREEDMDLAEQWNIAAFPDENSVSLSFCPIGILEIQFEQEEANHWIMSGECVTTPAGPGLHKVVADFIETLADRLDLEILFDDEAEYMDYHDFKKMAEDHGNVNDNSDSSAGRRGIYQSVLMLGSERIYAAGNPRHHHHAHGPVLDHRVDGEA